MADWNQFGTKQRQTLTCDVCEAMCLDAVDGTLSPPEQTAFELHVASCALCAEQFAEAQRGAAWMDMLKAHRPEPSSTLLGSILAKTTGTAATTLPQAHAAELLAPVLLPPSPLPLPAIVAAPALASGKLLQFRTRSVPRTSQAQGLFGSNQVYLQPRLAMTAAMAFFSLALTMNLTGTRLSDLRPGALHRTVSNAQAEVSRSFQSLPVVYQVESKVSELKQDELRDGQPDESPEPGNRSQPDPQPDTKAKPRDSTPDGSSRFELPSNPNFHRNESRGATGSSEQAEHDAADTQPTSRQKGA